MIMDNQHRITIPQEIREMFKIEQDEYYYVTLEASNEFSLRKDCKGKIIGKVKVDYKGRFYIPRSIRDILAYKKVVLYYKDNKIWISIFKENI